METPSEWYGIPRSTVYWLDRFEEMPIDDAIEDADQPGRPPALTYDEREKMRSYLPKPPQTFGFKAELWSIEAIQTYIEEKYGVGYSEGHIRRLLRPFDSHLC